MRVLVVLVGSDGDAIVRSRPKASSADLEYWLASVLLHMRSRGVDVERVLRILEEEQCGT